MVRVSQSSKGIAFWIHVTPRSRRERVGGTHGEALRVHVRAAPVKGAANEACVEALARAFGVRSQAIELDPGSRGRRKRVEVSGDAGVLARRLEELAAEPTGQ